MQITVQETWYTVGFIDFIAVLVAYCTFLLKTQFKLPSTNHLGLLFQSKEAQCVKPTVAKTTKIKLHI